MTTDARRRLEVVLDREIEVAQRLAATLAAEREALTGNSPTALAERAAEKTALLGTFEDLEGERRSLGDDPFAQHSDAATQRWRALLELMAGCRKANEVNGYIINVRRVQVHQLLDVVRGGPAVTYGPQGKTIAKALRALARA